MRDRETSIQGRQPGCIDKIHQFEQKVHLGCGDMVKKGEEGGRGK